MAERPLPSLVWSGLWISVVFTGCAPFRAARPPALPPPIQAPFQILSWNIQTFGNVRPDRRAVCQSAFEAVVSTAVRVIAVQEVANEAGLEIFGDLLPGESGEWAGSFEDTADSQDNGIVFRAEGATLTAEGFLFEDPGRGTLNTHLALHPVRWGHYRVGNFDFTLLSVHLTFQGGDARASAQEFWNILDWLKDYFEDPKHDPDVLIAGDFNLPSERGKPLSARSDEPDWITLESVIREHGAFASGPNRVTVLVDEPTSRPNKEPANNYDHFVVTQDVLEELLSAGRVPIERVDAADAHVRVRVSDHYPIEAWFRSVGEGVRPDLD